MVNVCKEKPVAAGALVNLPLHAVSDKRQLWFVLWNDGIHVMPQVTVHKTEGSANTESKMPVRNEIEPARVKIVEYRI